MTKVKLTNYTDFDKAQKGEIPPTEVRTVEIDALVDTGAVELAIPEEVAEKLGVRTIRRKKVRFADGRVSEVALVGGLLTEILEREFVTSAFVLPRGTTPLIGQIPLEALDLVLKPGTQEVITNPDHPDGAVLDMLSVA